MMNKDVKPLLLKQGEKSGYNIEGWKIVFLPLTGEPTLGEWKCKQAFKWEI